jgi:hypothetical protein
MPLSVLQEVMKRSPQVLVPGLLVCSMLPHTLLAVEPNVSTDTKSNAHSTHVDLTCIQVPERYRTTGPFTVQELEAESLRDWDQKKEQMEGSVPRVPFGKASAQWKEFLRELRKADKLLRYDEGCCTGIIIVRKGCIVDWFQTSEP